MKRIVRIVISVVLALSILFCIGWYFLEFDKSLTEDILFRAADYFEEHRNYKIANWLYNLTYSQTDHPDKIALNLAEKYRSIGNYTKAERTLLTAIKNGGGVELYIALSSVFVEQDKLLDAVHFLDSISNPVIAAEIAKIRPVAPQLEPTPGKFNTYISVDIHSTDRLYAAADGQYPSIKSDLYTKALELDKGESTVYAVSVDSQGLVSPLTRGHYVIIGVIEEVTFTDSAIEREIRKLLNVSNNSVLFTNALWEIKDFTVPVDATSYADLKLLTALETLTIQNGTHSELSELSSLNNLTTLNISDTVVSDSDLAVIANLPNLRSLSLKNCSVSSIDALAKATGLTYLDISGNAVRNLQALVNLQCLEYINISRNSVTNLGYIAGLTALRKLDISYNTLSDISALSGMTLLEELIAQRVELSDLSALQTLNNLRVLNLSENKISSITALKDLKKLTELNLNKNSISDISSISALTKLEILRISNNKIKTLPSLPQACSLIVLEANNNQITSVAPLKGLANLNTVYLDNNSSLSSLSGLETCPALVMVSVLGTKVKNATALTQYDIIVYYNPA